MKKANQMLTSALLAVVALAVLLTCAPTKAYGYTDPGTGTYMVQAVYAAFIGGVFYFRKLVQKIRGKGGNPNQ